jgi:hypothetical protein
LFLPFKILFLLETFFGGGGSGGGIIGING